MSISGNLHARSLLRVQRIRCHPRARAESKEGLSTLHRLRLVTNMSDSELEAIKQRKLRDIQKRWAARQKKPEKTDADEVLNKVFQGRAWEVFNAANQQFPPVMSQIKGALVKLASSGRLTEVTGEQLYLLLRTLGLRVRLNTTIRYTEHGKLKSLAEKIKEDLRNP